MAKSSQEYFGSPRLRGFLPFLNHLLWIGYRGRAPAWDEVWSHLLLMDDELVVLTALGPPSSVPLLAQQDEARTPRSLGDGDVWASVPYSEIRRVALHATGLRAHMPRLLVDARRSRGAWWTVDDRNHMWFDFSNLRHDPFDPAKVGYAQTLLRGVLPRRIKMVGF